jgi:hypothetical protein
MSRLIIGITGALALSVISGGAAEFARGRDLSPAAQGLSSLSASAREAVSSVNRASKADRTSAPAGSPASTETVSLKFDGFSDTTFLFRAPVAAANLPSAPAKPLLRKTMVACEPMVSLLTDVAKQLQPGRCFT